MAFIQSTKKILKKQKKGYTFIKYYTSEFIVSSNINDLWACKFEDIGKHSIYSQIEKKAR